MELAESRLRIIKRICLNRMPSSAKQRQSMKCFNIWVAATCQLFRWLIQCRLILPSAHFNFIGSIMFFSNSWSKYFLIRFEISRFLLNQTIFLLWFRSGGACLASVRPDHLLDLGEYKAWRDQNNKQKELEETSSGYRKIVKECLDAPRVVPTVFPLVSKKAWLETLLQTLKVAF